MSLPAMNPEGMAGKDIERERLPAEWI